MFGLQTAGAGLFARLLPIAVGTKYHTRLRLPPNRPPHLVQLHCALEQTSDESHPGLPGRHRKLLRQQTGAGCSGQRAQAPLTTGCNAEVHQILSPEADAVWAENPQMIRYQSNGGIQSRNLARGKCLVIEHSLYRTGNLSRKKPPCEMSAHGGFLKILSFI